ncbi:MAG: hemolysin III family protein [Clostridiales bacterium]|nr:hemolysin III family protein [Clostridiales bacterium]MBP5186067.1 hemolysin III family protein [Clostridiales bacterium]
MSTNKAFWRTWLEGRSAKKVNSEGAVIDPLEEGLSALAQADGEVPARKLKTQESFGEEIGNATTHGVMAVFMLGIIPYAAIHAYLNTSNGRPILNAVAISIFCISVFLMFLVSTIDHTMKHGTKQKEVFNRIDHIMIFYAIAGTYTPVCLTLIGGKWGLGLCIAQWVLVILGTMLKVIAFSKSLLSYIFSALLYLTMGWMIVLCFPILYAQASHVAFWLILAGGICYTSSVVLFFMRFKFAHMIFHLLVDFGAICHVIALCFFS